MSEQLNYVVPASQDCFQLELQTGPSGMKGNVLQTSASSASFLFRSHVASAGLHCVAIILLTLFTGVMLPAALWGFAWSHIVLSSYSLWTPLLTAEGWQILVWAGCVAR